ncbi:MAG: hypothetical protein ACXVXY_07220 [Mycobacteriaceae bacterium]
MWARITHRWADGSECDFEVQCDGDAYPDALDQVVAEVLRMYATVMTES